jgi:hypothetical protein
MFECCGKEHYYLNEIIMHLINEHSEDEYNSIIERIRVIEG